MPRGRATWARRPAGTRRRPCWPRRSGTRPAAGLVAGDQPGLRVEAVEGLPAKVLLDRACGAELLVLGGLTAAPGPGGHQPGDHVSPVALACLRASSCPVVVVTSPVVPPVPASPVVLASPVRR